MAARKVDQSLELARRFVARAPVLMTLIGLDGQLIEMSPPFISLFVTPAAGPIEQIRGRRTVEVAPELAAALADVRERLLQGEAIAYVEQTIVGDDGQPFSFRSQASLWRDEAGRPLALLFVHQDINSEIATQAALAASAAQLRAVVDNLPSQIALMDVGSGRVELVNEKMRIGLALGCGAAAGQSTYEVMPAGKAAELRRTIAQAVRSGGAVEFESAADDGVGADRIIRQKYVVFDDQAGRPQLLWIADDVTELRRATEGLERAAAEAEAANRAKSEFLANMSHEIRTPLNGVMGVAGALAKTPLTPHQREMVALIGASAQTLETLLSDILDVARIEAGKMELSSEPFDLAHSVGACAALFDAAAQAKGLDLEVTIAPEALGAYVGDAPRIRQILSNLLGNALKFTTHGQVALSVSAQGGETSSRLTFVVRDTGIGFDAETKARLFSRFEQADGSITRRFGGSGLGLSISRSLAEAMGGHVEGDAEPGEGAVFTLTLDLPRCESAPDLWFDPDAESATDPLLGLRVLLAEDHPTNRRVVELILEAAGVALTCVENGVEAVDAFRRGVFDLVLMDMQMPLLDGLSAITEIRRIEAASARTRTPIHVLTANAMPEHVRSSYAVGADGHLSKPIVADALLKRVAEAAERRPATGAAPGPGRAGRRG